MVEIKRHQNIFDAYIRSGRYLDAMETIGIMLSVVQKLGYQNLYDIREPNSIFQYTVPLILPQIQQKLHVGAAAFQNRTQSVVEDCLRPADKLYSEIIPRTRILLYNGQFDVFASYAQASLFLSALRWDGAKHYYDLPRKQWILDQQLAGYWKTVGNLTHVFVRNAGHFVGKTQPKAFRYMINSFVEDKFN